MGSFLNTVFSILLGWIKGLVSMIWSAFNAQGGESFLQFIGKNWIVITVVICSVGIVADFVVYLFRWEPYKVWKTFWRKLRKKKQEEVPVAEPEYFAGNGVPETDAPESFAESETEAFQEEYDGQYVAQDNEEYDNGYGEEYSEQTPEEDEFYRWRERTDRPENTGIPAYTEAEVTRAGYVVPADSPYRRPSTTADDAQEESIYSPQPRRRRRFSGLLGDSGEEDFRYFAPKPMVDQRDAYRAPVYPEKWNESRDQGQ